MLGEFGDDPCRSATAKNRRNDAGTSPITRASGKKRIVAARFVRNDRLIDALMIQAFAAAGLTRRPRLLRRPATNELSRTVTLTASPRPVSLSYDNR
jgi:hypothetical protein